MIGVVSQLLDDHAAILWVARDKKKFLYLPERPDEIVQLSLKDRVKFELEDGHAVNVQVITDAPAPTTRSGTNRTAMAN